MLTDDEECRETGCSNLATTAGYCRVHYIKNWPAIKRKEALLKDGRFRRYVEELVAKYPEAVIRAVRQDLSSDEAFEKARLDLDLHEGDEDIVYLDELEEPERKAG